MSLPLTASKAATVFTLLYNVDRVHTGEGMKWETAEESLGDRDEEEELVIENVFAIKTIHIL